MTKTRGRNSFASCPTIRHKSVRINGRAVDGRQWNVVSTVGPALYGVDKEPVLPSFDYKSSCTFLRAHLVCDDTVLIRYVTALGKPHASQRDHAAPTIVLIGGAAPNHLDGAPIQRES